MLEPPEVLENGKTGQNHPKHIEENNGREGFFCRRPNKGNAGDNGKDVEPPELLAEQKTGEDDGNLCCESPCFYGVNFCPIFFGAHSL